MPVSATKRAASSGSVYTFSRSSSAFSSPSWPVVKPISASTSAPYSRASSTAPSVSATFSS